MASPCWSITMLSQATWRLCGFSVSPSIPSRSPMSVAVFLVVAFLVNLSRPNELRIPVEVSPVISRSRGRPSSKLSEPSPASPFEERRAIFATVPVWAKQRTTHCTSTFKTYLVSSASAA
eukprot:CAMPEP_0181397688 /NCGR_PEP_ID=MMETSP1110-20121109/626_1 /TAXON_ID=174948 /ORGANISM="Symbiodinium sp., Strain CCMP421" /LENGTH=119 /DNA_ID=CAMNT_0023519559 /DNA_START=53 /DNA_END=412 /DNA_ORIENTATION=+